MKIYHYAAKDFDHFTARSFSGLMWNKGTSYLDRGWKNSVFTLPGCDQWKFVRQGWGGAVAHSYHV